MTASHVSPPGRVILVTGSSSGLGKACCDRLAQASGNRVYGASRTFTATQPWKHIPMDVTDDASVAAGVAEVIRQDGRIDAVVHCAGSSLAGPIEDTRIDEAQRQFDTNYFGAVRIIRTVLPGMRQRGQGQIIMVGSIGGMIGLPFLAHYSATKFALDGLVEALRTEVEPLGVQATIVHPGDFHTSLGANRLHCTDTKSGTTYFERFTRSVAFYDAAEKAGGSADDVARKVESLLDRRRLPARLVVGSPLEIAGVWAKALMPSRCFEYIFRKAYSP